MVDDPVNPYCDNAAEQRNAGPCKSPDPKCLLSGIYPFGVVVNSYRQPELDEEADKAEAEDDDFHDSRPKRCGGLLEGRPIFNYSRIALTPYYIRVSLSGLEPETYGLKVRCSTD
jgi:hypothetical protein